MGRRKLSHQRNRQRTHGTRRPTGRLLLLHVCLVLGASRGLQAAGSIASDRTALLAVTAEFTNWDSYFDGLALQGWKQGGAPCSWSQVSCNAAGRVSKLDLSCDQCNYMLRGPLPSSLPLLDALTSLDLSGNSVTGTLPPQWGAANTFQLLTTLNLADNVLSGELPPSWATAPAFAQLRALNLSHNTLGGSLPDAWTDPSGFKALSIMEVADNNLVGTLPPGMGDPAAFPALTYLDVAGNDLLGSLPDTWGAPGAFPMLKDLDASRNHLTGPLPPSWGSNAFAFSNLTVLSLYANRLQGELPGSWGRGGGFQGLRELYLDSNALTGPLPPLWGSGASSWPNLVELGLSSCQLSGTLPAEWGSGGGILKLQQLYLSYNRLSGTVPAAWTALPALTDLWLRPANWELCGALPTSAAFTVCRANGTACVPVVNSLVTGCESKAMVNSSNVEAVVRILGYNMQPFKKAQQEALQQSLAADLGMQSQDQVLLTYVQEVADPLLHIDQISDTNIGRRRLLLGDDGQSRKLLQASGGSSGPGVPRVITRDILMSGGLPIQAVDVTLELVSNTGEQAAVVSSALEEDVSGPTNELLKALVARGVNATGTQLLYNSFEGDTGIVAEAVNGSSIDRSDDEQAQDHRVEVIVGSVSGVVVAVLLTVAALCFVARRKRRRRSAAAAASGARPPAGIWDKGLTDGQPSNQSSCAALSISTGGSTPIRGGRHSTQPSLVFPPLSIADKCIDQDNLFKGNDGSSVYGTGGSDPKSLDIGTSDSCGSSSGGEGVQLPRVPFSDWELRPDDIRICSHPDGRPWELGAGAFGQVFKAQLGVQTVAVKMLTGQNDPAAQDQFCREIAILRSCRCLNVVMFCGACVSGNNTMIVCEYMEGGDLWRILDKDRSRAVFGWYRRGKKVALDVACGLHYLHSHRIVHFDLKSQNILLARDGTAKIADVGLARVLNREYLTSLHVAGTFAWAAPELLLGSRCTEKVDIYSFGMVLWEIITGERPLRGQIRDLRVPEECPAEVEDLVVRCMAADASTRPSAKQIHEALLAVPYPALQGVATQAGPTAAAATGQRPAAAAAATNRQLVAAPGQRLAPAPAQNPANLVRSKTGGNYAPVTLLDHAQCPAEGDSMARLPQPDARSSSLAGDSQAADSPAADNESEVLQRQMQSRQQAAYASPDVQEAARQLSAQYADEHGGMGAAAARWPPVQTVSRMQSPFGAAAPAPAEPSAEM